MNDLTFLALESTKWLLKLIIWSQHSYSFNVKLVGVPKIAETGSKEPAIDTTKLCVGIFQAMGCNISINDIDIAHRVPARNAINGPKPIICRFVRRLIWEVMSRWREITRVDSIDVGSIANCLNNYSVSYLITLLTLYMLMDSLIIVYHHKYLRKSMSSDLLVSSMLIYLT